MPHTESRSAIDANALLLPALVFAALLPASPAAAGEVGVMPTYAALSRPGLAERDMAEAEWRRALVVHERPFELTVDWDGAPELGAYYRLAPGLQVGSWGQVRSLSGAFAAGIELRLEF